MQKLLFIGLFTFLVHSAYSQNDIRIRFVELHGEYFGNLKVKNNGTEVSIKQPGAGISINLGKKFLSSVLEYNYRVFDLSPISAPKVKYQEIMFGIRYFPMIPTFMIGNTATRITLGALGGFDLEPNWRYMVFGGLFFSPIRSVNGISLNIVYRPKNCIASGYTFEPAWALRLGFIFGPSFK
jgi:hypothetical protein